MKKNITLLLVLAMSLSLSACGSAAAAKLADEDTAADSAALTEQQMQDKATELTETNITTIVGDVYEGKQYEDTYCAIKGQVQSVDGNSCEIAPLYLQDGKEIAAPEYIILKAELNEVPADIKEAQEVTIVGHVESVDNEITTPNDEDGTEQGMELARKVITMDEGYICE